MPARICPCGYSVPKGAKCPCQQRRAKDRQQTVDAARPSAAARGYDREWAAVRADHLAANPQCIECGAPASHVDHIVSIRQAPHRRLDRTNLRSMCHPCHSRRTARDQSRGWGRGAGG